MRLLYAILIWVACGTALAATPVKRIYVFGDSYSDIGRGYVDSDGPTALFYLAQKLGLEMVASNAPDPRGKSLDFAVSGAPTGEHAGGVVQTALLGLGMKNQVAEFAAMARSGTVSFDQETTVFYLAGGLNDRSLPTAKTVENLEAEMQSLYALGARRFRIAILPEKIPSFSEVGLRLNPALERIPSEMGSRLKGAEVETSRWGAFFDEVMLHAAKYGFTNTTEQCAGRAIFKQDATPCASPTTHYFYHASHPSTAVHKVVGDMLFAEMVGAQYTGPTE